MGLRTNLLRLTAFLLYPLMGWRRKVRLGQMMVEQEEDVAERAAEILRRYGVVILPLPIEGDVIDKARERITQFISEAREAMGDKTHYSCKDYHVQDGLTLFDHYGALSDADRPVVYIRRGQTDDGLIDLFGVDEIHLEGDEFKRAIDAVRSDLVKHILKHATGVEYERTSTNLYHNESITHTRRLHVDGLIPRAKSFLMLTDVTSLEDGPYTYVPRSHRWKRINGLNHILNRFFRHPGAVTDSTLISEKLGMPLTAKKGMLIISFQHGAHRGWPQGQGRMRTALVQSWDPDEGISVQ